jgi:transposase
MRPRGSAELLEDRRHRALRLLDEGLSLNEVGRRIGCAPSSVLRWRNRLADEGPEGLAVRSAPGRPPKLSESQLRRLVRILLKGALARGYRTELWTTARIAEVIEEAFGVQYHRDQVGRLMHRLGWSSQKPERRALERDDERIERWKREEWPRVKKTPNGWVPTSSSSTNPDSC